MQRGVMLLIGGLLLLVLAGCADADWQFALCATSVNSIVVGYSEDGKYERMVETRNGARCVEPLESGESPRSKCREFDEWDDPVAYAHMRHELGIPLDVCVTCQSGQVICPGDDE